MDPTQHTGSRLGSYLTRHCNTNIFSGEPEPYYGVFRLMFHRFICWLSWLFPLIVARTPVGNTTQATENSLRRRSKSSLQHLAWIRLIPFYTNYPRLCWWLAARVKWNKMVEVIDDIAVQAELTSPSTSISQSRCSLNP